MQMPTGRRTYNVGAVAEDVSHPLKRGTPRQKPGRQRMPEAMGVGVNQVGPQLPGIVLLLLLPRVESNRKVPFALVAAF